MNIIIPLGGLGERFKKEDYLRPKPLINILGKEMICHLIDNLNVHVDDNIYIIYNKDLDKHNFCDIIMNKYKNIHLIRLDIDTRGATETVLYGLNKLNDNLLSKKIMLLDCDTFYFTDIIGQYRSQTENAVYCFHDVQEKPIYSYIKFDSDFVVTDIKEKQKISDYANTGCYCFKNGYILKKYCECVITNDIRMNNEFYTSCVISEMIKDGHTFIATIINQNDFKCVGTPLQLKIFCSSEKKYSKLRFSFNDFDLNSNILAKHIDYLRFLKKLGHTLVLYSSNNCVDQNIMHMFDEIIYDKPMSDFYVNTKSINLNNDIEKEIGIYKTNISEREFNQIIPGTMEVITKKSTNDKIKGEIFYYQNIPASVKNYFPLFITHGSDWYMIEKINGITLSYLYVNESLSQTVFNQYLCLIDKIHNSIQYDENIHGKLNIYENYLNKIKKRYSEYNYKQFNNHKSIYDLLVQYFEQYENNKNGIISVIHGDPVFSNCLIDNYNNFKLIDMRGQLGNNLTIFGDKYYDYGKIYQSITGYDEILLNKKVSINYKISIIDIFNKFIINKYGTDALNTIKMIRNSLLFTLIPLHNNEKCQSYLNLIEL